MTRVVVVGAGVGGLSAAGALVKAGLEVTVLEAQVIAGGCAGTFYHQGYRFDVGATLAGGFYPGGPMDILAKATAIQQWPVHPVDRVITVHLPDYQTITRWNDDRSRFESKRLFGPEADIFWDWQERTADALWNLAMRLPSWPPQSIGQVQDLIKKGTNWMSEMFPRHFTAELVVDAFRPISYHLAGLTDLFKLYIDSQLLIASQTTSESTYALYGASALDLPRRGVMHIVGGVGSIADTLVDAIRRHGGKVHFRSEVSRVERNDGHYFVVHTRHGEEFPADIVIFNLPPWNIARLLENPRVKRLGHRDNMPKLGWGAFMVYAGLSHEMIPYDLPLHHQVILRRPLGEGNTVFVSLSPAWDTTRAPAGSRALTISTHTAMEPWWSSFETDRQFYEAKKEEYTDRLLTAGERAIPGIKKAIQLVLAGTPVTFQRFTRRVSGWVGGFPQTSLFTNRGPKIAKNVWMVGDSIFPGQSIAAVALGGLRVANDVRATMASNKFIIQKVMKGSQAIQ